MRASVAAEPRLRQACDLDLRELLVRDIGERVAAPERQSLIEQISRVLDVAVAHRVVATRREGLEPERRR